MLLRLLVFSVIVGILIVALDRLEVDEEEDPNSEDKSSTIPKFHPLMINPILFRFTFFVKGWEKINILPEPLKKFLNSTMMKTAAISRVTQEGTEEEKALLTVERSARNGMSLSTFCNNKSSRLHKKK